MRILLILPSLLLSHFLLSQSYKYTPFPQYHGEWNYGVYSDNWYLVGSSTFTYHLDTATGLMMNGTYGYYEDQKRIYIVSGTDTTLRYDFNLSIGDSITTNGLYGPDTFYVISDDSLGYYGRRQLTLQGNNNHLVFWAEGIGNVYFGNIWDNFAYYNLSGGLIFKCVFSDSITFPCSSFLGEASYIKDPEFEVYPTPNNGRFFIKSNHPESHNISIYNSQGKLFHSTSNSGLSPLELNLQHLKAGLYFIELRSSHQVQTKRVIIR